MHDIFRDPAIHTLESFLLKRMVLSPKHWGRYTLKHRLKWKPVQFKRSNLKKVPANQKGVYSFIVRPKIASHPQCAYLMYIGMVEDQSFKARFSQYLKEQSDGPNARRIHVTELLCKWDSFLWFYFAPISKKSLIKKTEDALLEAYLPPSNRRFPATVKHHIAKLFSQ